MCRHAERDAIDRQLVEAVTGTGTIAARYGLAKASVKRHAAAHVPAAVAPAVRAAAVTRADDLLARVEALTADTQAILGAAKEGKDHELALRAIARLEKQTELLARLVGELRDGPTVNVFVGPAWQAVLAVLLRALAPYPAVRAEVGDALARLAAATGTDGAEVPGA